MTKKAALYARVSTTDQAEKGYSLPSQLAACRKYAEELGYLVAQEYAEDISGAVPLRDRPYGRELFGLIQGRKVQAVIVYTHDRVARDEAGLEFLILHRDCANNGVELHTVDSGKVSDSPYGRIIDYAKAAGAAEERAKIRERTMRGREAKAKSGKWVGAPFAPYGYRRVGKGPDCHLEIDEAEAAIVRYIFARYTGSDGLEPAPLKTIAVELTENGTPPAARGTKGSKGWHMGTLRGIITRRTYLGELWHKGVKVATVPALAFVDPAAFELAQGQRQKNRERSQRNRRRQYLLSGHMRCMCGATMAGHTYVNRKGHEYPYYECAAQLVHKHLTECRVRPVQLRRVESAIWERLTARLDPETLEQGLREEQRQRQAQLGPLRERLATVQELIKKADRTIQRLAVSVGQLDRDDEEQAAAVAALEAELVRASKHRAALIKDGQRIESDLAQQDYDDDTLEAIKSRVAAIRADIEGAGFEDMRFTLAALDVRAQLMQQGEKQAVVLEYVLESGPVELPLEVGQPAPPASGQLASIETCSSAAGESGIRTWRVSFAGIIPPQPAPSAPA